MLLGAATLQLKLAGIDGTLNAAKGGGFGLFSTVDKYENRHPRIYLLAAGGEVRVPPPTKGPNLDAVMNAVSAPTQHNLDLAMNKLMASDRLPPQTGGLRLEVWTMDFDPVSHALTTRKTAETTALRMAAP